MHATTISNIGNSRALAIHVNIEWGKWPCHLRTRPNGHGIRNRNLGGATVNYLAKRLYLDYETSLSWPENRWDSPISHCIRATFPSSSSPANIAKIKLELFGRVSSRCPAQTAKQIQIESQQALILEGFHFPQIERTRSQSFLLDFAEMGKGKKNRDLKRTKVKKRPTQRTYAEVLQPIENILPGAELKHTKTRMQKKEETKGDNAVPSNQQGKLTSSTKLTSRPDFPPLQSPELPVATTISHTQKLSFTSHQGRAEELATRTSLHSRIPSKAVLKARATTLGQLFYRHQMIVPRSPLYILFPPPLRTCDLRRASARPTLTRPLE